MQSASISGTRLATPADASELVELMREFYAESSYPLDKELARNTFLKLLTRPDLGCVWVATLDGSVAGYVVLTLRYTMEHGAFCGHIDDLYVRPSHRRQGIGFALLSELLAECKRRECGAIHVEVGNSNAPAIDLYRRLGLEEFKDGRVLLQKCLNAAGT